MTTPICPECGSADVATNAACTVCNRCGHAAKAAAFRKHAVRPESIRSSSDGARRAPMLDEDEAGWPDDLMPDRLFDGDAA